MDGLAVALSHEPLLLQYLQGLWGQQKTRENQSCLESSSTVLSQQMDFFHGSGQEGMGGMFEMVEGKSKQ